MKNVAFTICATNYVGLAKVLERSIYKHYKDLDFYIIVADEPSEVVRNSFEENILVAKDVLDYSEQKWYEMAFKYNLTEFCTAIKPASILYLLGKGYEKCIYFDPDIFVYSSIELIYNYLDNYNAVVTPHITEIEKDYTGNLKEDRLLFSGTFNLGFFAINNASLSCNFLEWWSKRLEDYCFANLTESLFTDQKWVDMLPSFFSDKLLVCRNKGLNMAPWNFHERVVSEDDGVLYVANRFEANSAKTPLVFVHYSGYNYKALLSGEVEQKNIKKMAQYTDLGVIFDVYRTALTEGQFSQYIDQNYTYNYYNVTEKAITARERILFRGYVEGTGYDENPFSNESYFYQKLKALGFLKIAGKPQTFEDSMKEGGQQKIGKVNKVFKILFKLIGAERYYTMTRVFFKYSIWENHYFLVKKDSEEYKMRRF